MTDTTYEAHSQPMSIFQKIKNKFRSRMKVIPEITDAAYMRINGSHVQTVKPQMVESCARTLESALAMSETLPAEAVMTLDFSVVELASFVCYMRQLDNTYRAQLAFITRHIKPTGDSPGEFQISEEAAAIGAERFAKLAAVTTGAAPHGQPSQLPEKHPGDVSVAEVADIASSWGLR